MNKLATLVYKEWRDQRSLCIVSMVLCVLLLVGAKLVVGSSFDSQLRLHSILPICFGIFTLILSVESIARDVQSGVSITFARLPVNPSLAWRAKLAFVMLAGAAFFVVLALVELSLIAFEKRLTAGGLLDLLRPEGCALMLTITSAGFAAACVLRRSLPAAILAALLVGGPLLALASLSKGALADWIAIALERWSPLEVMLLASLALLSASWLAFRLRRPDALGWCRAGLACACLAIFAVPPLAWSAQRASSAAAFPLFDERAHIERVSASPDGRLLAVDLQLEWPLVHNWMDASRPFLSSGRTCTRCELWVLDRSSGQWSGIDERWRRTYPVIAGGFDEKMWDARGHLAAWSSAGAFGHGDERMELLQFSDTTRPLMAWSRSWPNSGAYEGFESELGIVRWYEKRSRGTEHYLYWKEKNIEVRMPNTLSFGISPEPGVVFYVEDGSLVRRELQEAQPRILCAIHDRDAFPRISPDGRWLFFVDQKQVTILDAHDGRLIKLLEPLGYLQSWSTIPGRIGLVSVSPPVYYLDKPSAAKRQWFALLEDGSLQWLPADRLRCQELGAQKLLSSDWHEIELIDIESGARERLYPRR